MWMWCLGLLATLVLMPRTVVADDRCMWQNDFYDPGSVSCQDGIQARCVNRAWQPTGEQCAGDAPAGSGEDSAPGVAEPRVGQPDVVEPGAGGVSPPQVPPVGD
jgi:hypothetical protein